MHAAHSPRPGAGPRNLPFGHSCAAPSASDWQAVADGMVAAVSACAVAAAPPAANPNSSKPKLRNSTGGRRRCTTDNLNAADLGATGAEAHCVRRVRAASGRRPATKRGARGGGVRAGGARAVAAWAKEPWWCDGGSSCLRWKVTSDAAAGVCYAHLHGRGLWRRGRYVLTCSRRETSQHRACARGSLRC